MDGAKEMRPREEDASKLSEVKSAMEIALERAERLEGEPIEIQTGEGAAVSMTFEELKAKAVLTDEYLDQLKYKQAEFENYRRRTLKEREDLLNEMIPVTDLFEILDQLDRALSSTGDAEVIKQGVAVTRKALWSLLERKGVERVPGEGEPFDPSHHEAVASHPHESVPSGSVAVEYQSGFKIGERVLRPSKVIVSTGPPA
jgi:molecular chaperone GrpE